MFKLELTRESLSSTELGRVLEALGETVSLMDNMECYKITVTIEEEGEPGGVDV